MNEIHIGEEIKKVFERKNLSVSEFARRINKSRENVYDIFTRQTIDTGLLITISTILEYNFFLMYSEKYQQRNYDLDTLVKENQMLKDVIDTLKMKIK
jgi:hypothetical protein